MIENAFVSATFLGVRYDMVVKLRTIETPPHPKTFKSRAYL